MEELIALFNAIAPLSPALEEYLRDLLKPRYAGKKEILLREGDIAKHINYIEKGLVRSYYWIEEEEVCSWFMKEGDIFVSVQSFFFQSPSYETIEMIEDGIIWGISYSQLQHAYKHFPEFNYHRGVILEKYYSLSEQRHYMTRRQTAYKRYVSLLEREQYLLQRVPAKYLASYLGMTEGTFSHIRSEYAAKSRKGL